MILQVGGQVGRTFLPRSSPRDPDTNLQRDDVSVEFLVVDGVGVVFLFSLRYLSDVFVGMVK